MIQETPPSKVEIGRRIESAAASWFVQSGPGRTEVARNYRLRTGEIDLIFEEGQASGAMELVFIEVRFRRRGGMQSGLESVGFRKQLRLARAIRHFLARYRGKAKTLRLDVLSWDGASWEHFRDI